MSSLLVSQRLSPLPDCCLIKRQRSSSIVEHARDACTDIGRRLYTTTHDLLLPDRQSGSARAYKALSLIRYLQRELSLERESSTMYTSNGCREGLRPDGEGGGRGLAASFLEFSNEFSQTICLKQRISSQNTRHTVYAVKSRYLYSAGASLGFSSGGEGGNGQKRARD